MLDNSILHYCNYQERCHMEVRNRLYQIGFTAAEVERQLAELIESGALNEERFARSYARGKFRLLQWGRVKIRQELKRKGISEYCIKKGMTEIDETEYSLTMERIAKVKARQGASVGSIMSRKAKVYRYLLQKGYEADMISALIKQLVQ